MPAAMTFSMEITDDYIRSTVCGSLDLATIEQPFDAMMALAEEKHITKVLDDVRELDSSNLGIKVQSKAMGLLWKMRVFDKVAFLSKPNRLQNMLQSTMETMRLNITTKFKGFTDEAEAIAWLQEK
jgi:hypothetical protein